MRTKAVCSELRAQGVHKRDHRGRVAHYALQFPLTPKARGAIFMETSVDV